MTAPATSQAHVQAVLDFANMDTEFANRLQQVTQQAERVVNRNLQGITRAAQSSSTDINRAFDRIVLNIDARQFTTGMQNAERDSRNAGRTIERSMDQAEQATHDAGESSHKFADSMGEMVGKAAGAATGVLGIAGAFETLSTIVERGELANKLGAELDLTKDESAQAGKIAGQVYAQNYGQSFEGVTEATGAVLSTLGNLADSGGAAIEDLTKRVLVFSDTFGVEAAEVAQSANNLVGQGLAKDAPEALDMLAAAFQRVPKQMRDEVLPILDEYSTNLSALGFDGESALGLIVNASQDGAIAMDKVGDAIKEFGIRATDIGDTGAQDALKELGFDAEATANQLLQGGDQAKSAFDKIVAGLRAMDDPGKQAAAAVALFGTPLEDLDKTKIPSFLTGLSNSGSAMGDFGGTIDEMGNRLSEGPGAQLELLKRQIEDVLITKMGQAAGVVREHSTTFEILAAAVGVAVIGYGLLQAAAAVSAISLGIHAAAAGADTAALVANKLAMGAYTAATVAMRVGTLAGAAATAIATAATWAFNAAMAVLTAPITLIVLAIAGFIAAIVLLYQKNQTFRDFITAAWAWIQNAVQVAWQIIQGIFSAIVGWIVTSLIPTMQSLWDKAVTVFNAISAAVMYWWNTIMVPIIHDVQLLFTAILIPMFMQARDVAVAVFNAISAAVMWFWHNAVEPAFQIISSIMSAWWTSVQVGFDFVKAGLGLLGDAFMFVFNATIAPIFETAKVAVSAWWDAVQFVFEKAKSGIGLLGDAFGAAGRIMSGIWDGVLAAMRPAIHAIGHVLAGLPKSLGPVEIPGAGAANDLGKKLEAFAGGGLFRGRGSGRSDSNLALVSDGEYWVNADATAKHLPLLEAINGGALDRYAGGGLVNTNQLRKFAQGIEGVDYVWGGWGQGWSTDCSGAASALANYATTQADAGKGQRSGTGAMSGFLSGLGAQPGLGPKGSLNFGWYNGGPYGGHIATTLPTGEHVEMGGARGDGQFAGKAAGAEDAMFDQHAHFPPEFFAGGDLGGGGGALAAGGAGSGTGGAGGLGGAGGGAGLSGGAAGGSGAGGGVAGDAVQVFVTNWPPGGLSSPPPDTATAGAAGAGTGTAPSAAAGGTAPAVGVDAANAWAAEQDFPKQAQDWAAGALKEIFGQVSEPFGVKNLTDKAVDDLKTAAQALAAARAQNPAPVVGVMNINGAGDPQATATAVIDSLGERMNAVTGRFRNGG